MTEYQPLADVLAEHQVDAPIAVAERLLTGEREPEQRPHLGVGLRYEERDGTLVVHEDDAAELARRVCEFQGRIEGREPDCPQNDPGGPR